MYFEELVELNNNYNDGLNLYEEVAEIPTEEAIEIVKQGGVSDDVCEWKHSGNVYISCNYKRFTDLHSFDYCPYCGKKIKVVIKK